jgi:hypothetical protein
MAFHVYIRVLPNGDRDVGYTNDLIRRDEQTITWIT